MWELHNTTKNAVHFVHGPTSTEYKCIYNIMCRCTHSNLLDPTNHSYMYDQVFYKIAQLVQFWRNIWNHTFLFAKFWALYYVFAFVSKLYTKWTYCAFWNPICITWQTADTHHVYAFPLSFHLHVVCYSNWRVVRDVHSPVMQLTILCHNYIEYEWHDKWCMWMKGVGHVFFSISLSCHDIFTTFCPFLQQVYLIKYHVQLKVYLWTKRGQESSLMLG